MAVLLFLGVSGQPQYDQSYSYDYVDHVPELSSEGNLFEGLKEEGQSDEQDGEPVSSKLSVAVRQIAEAHGCRPADELVVAVG